MRKLFLTVGVSASGKTTWAEQQILTDLSNGIITTNINRDDIRFNYVMPGSNWSTYKFTKTRELEVSRIAMQQFIDAIMRNDNIIISDTNLNKVFRDDWIERATDAGYEVIIQEFPITLEEAWKRDASRPNGVGHNVIYEQYKLWEDYICRKKYVPNENKPNAILIDIDGTIAEKGDRYIFDWMKVDVDLPRTTIIAIIKSFITASGAIPIFLSGRDSICYELTRDWIINHTNITDPLLYMRPENDQRKDTLIKEEIFWEHIADHYNIIAAFDDRPCIVRLYNSIGVPNVIAVADQHKEF